MTIARVTEFISKLESCQCEETIKALCSLELDYLRSEYNVTIIFDAEGYPIGVAGKGIQTLSSTLSSYRNEVRSLNLTPSNSYIKVKNGKKEKYHKALLYLKLEDYERDTLNSLQRAKDKADKSDRPSFDAVQVVLKAIELIDSKSYTKKALGLYVLTGRRYGEIMQTAKFESTGLSCSLLTGSLEDGMFYALFSGQQKTTKKGQSKRVDKFGIEKQNDTPYKIPLLSNIYKIQETVEWLRDNHPCDINKRPKGSKELSVACSKEFKGLLDNVTPHRLRSAYCAILWAYLKDSRVNRCTEDLFIDAITGHSSDTTESANAYMDYELNSKDAEAFKNYFDGFKDMILD